MCVRATNVAHGPGADPRQAAVPHLTGVTTGGQPGTSSTSCQGTQEHMHTALRLPTGLHLSAGLGTAQLARLRQVTGEEVCMCSVDRRNRNAVTSSPSRVTSVTCDICHTGLMGHEPERVSRRDRPQPGGAHLPIGRGRSRASQSHNSHHLRAFPNSGPTERRQLCPPLLPSLVSPES
jgi:hypothetical protein